MSFERCLEYTVSVGDTGLVWQSLGEGGVFITRENGVPFVFAAATDQPPTLKLDVERLGAHPALVDRLLGLYALHPCVQAADVLSFVPNGMAEFGERLGRRIGKQVIQLVRHEGAARSDIQFVSRDDQALAREVGTVCMLEDVSRTGFSAHAAARTLRAVNRGLDIHSLSILQRDDVDPSYIEGSDSVAYHTFVRQDIPLTLEEFRERYPDIHVDVVA